MIVEEFEIWIKQNRDKFICKPYIHKDRTKSKIRKYLELRFEDIIPELYVYVNEQEICAWIDLEKVVKSENIDLLADFYVEAKQNDKGKYYNGLHIKPYTYYNTLKEVYYEEFNCFLTWANSIIKKENSLALAWNGGITSARIINPESQPEEYELYRNPSGKTGFSPTGNEALLSQLVNTKNKKIISPSREKEWHSKLLKLSLKM